jgi:hypothetical protein
MRELLLPFDFPYANNLTGALFTRLVLVSTNGFIALDPAQAPPNTYLPTADQIRPGLVAPLWCDLNPNGVGKDAAGRIAVEAVADRVVVTWDFLPLYADFGPSGSLSFRCVLRAAAQPARADRASRAVRTLGRAQHVVPGAPLARRHHRLPLCARHRHGLAALDERARADGRVPAHARHQRIHAAAGAHRVSLRHL